MRYTGAVVAPTHRWALVGWIHAGGDGRRMAREATDNGLLAPELAAGTRAGRVKSVGVRTKRAQALLSAPDITTTKGLRDRAIIAVLLGCALRRCEVAALADGRCSGAFTAEATVAARYATTPERSA